MDLLHPTMVVCMQVQKHQQKVQQDKEDAAVEKLASLMPQMGSMARALALTKTNWDVEAALSMLRQFQVACLEKLNVVTKVRGTPASHQQLLSLNNMQCRPDLPRCSVQTVLALLHSTTGFPHSTLLMTETQHWG
jgi:hypothetical protein